MEAVVEKKGRVGMRAGLEGGGGSDIKRTCQVEDGVGSYFIFVISFTQAGFSNSKFST